MSRQRNMIDDPAERSKARSRASGVRFAEALPSIAVVDDDVVGLMKSKRVTGVHPRSESGSSDVIGVVEVLYEKVAD